MRLKLIQQDGPTDCGIACVTMIVKGIKDRNITKHKIKDKVKQKWEKESDVSRREGSYRTSWEDIKWLLKQNHVKSGNTIVCKNWKDMIKKNKNKIIILAQVNKRKDGNWHWVVIENDNSWWILDPKKN